MPQRPPKDRNPVQERWCSTVTTLRVIDTTCPVFQMPGGNQIDRQILGLKQGRTSKPGTQAVIIHQPDQGFGKSLRSTAAFTLEDQRGLHVSCVA